MSRTRRAPGGLQIGRRPDPNGKKHLGRIFDMNSLVRRQTLGDLLRRSAARSPHKLAIACGDNALELRPSSTRSVDRLAAGLPSSGVVKGERVAILARNSHAFAAMRFALARLGAVLVPINFMLKPDEVAYILRHAGARMLATDSGLAPVARAASEQVSTVERLIWLPSEGAERGAGRHDRLPCAGRLHGRGAGGRPRRRRPRPDRLHQRHRVARRRARCSRTTR